jgi:hypothetical protein
MRCGSYAGRWRAGTATRWRLPDVQTAAGPVAVAAQAIEAKSKLSGASDPLDSF